jgi:hypothetical protein
MERETSRAWKSYYTGNFQRIERKESLGKKKSLN